MSGMEDKAITGAGNGLTGRKNKTNEKSSYQIKRLHIQVIGIFSLF
jgi:hypothetical protein